MYRFVNPINYFPRLFIADGTSYHDQVFPRNIFPPPVNTQRVMAHPFASRAISMAEVIRRSQSPPVSLFKNKREVLGMVITVAGYHVKHHTAEHLFGFGVSQLQFSHGLE